MQGLDRYTYVNNNPSRFTDPSGHRCFPKNECAGANGQKEPENIDFRKLDDYVYRGSGVSGQMMYRFYLKIWEGLQKDGKYLSIRKFIEMILAHEFEPYQNSDGTLNIDDTYKSNLKATTFNWFWKLNRNATGVEPEAALNWIAGFGSAGLAFRAGSLTGTKANPLAREVLDVVYSGHGMPHFDPTQPSTFGNASLHPGLLNASEGTAYDQYIDIWPGKNDGNPAFILSQCQAEYQNGNMDYVHDNC